ncbi:signal peptidase II [uncultured Oscillibacter sp.]|uniref:signal peptidase II n=1 Tax=uncultured Oscillibacter sp. TaxID=876091 RepID=UPI0025D642FC|nr:signal peptidase II [uncultured Oscillibacter sp.]
MLTAVCTAAAVLSACTAARWYLCRTSRRETSRWGGRVRLTELWNQGAAFGLPIGRRTLLALSAGALAAVIRRRGKSPAAAGLVLGGGLANLWERLRYGRVYDYLRFPKAPGPLGRYVYNLADLALFAGAAGLLLGRRRRRPARPPRRGC